MTINEVIQYLKYIEEFKGNIAVPPSLQQAMNDFIRNIENKKTLKL